MLTVLKSIELSSDYLKEKGVESSRINAELLLASILNCKRMDLYLRFDQPLSKDEISEYRNYIKRRGMREPLQYIIGSVEFYGLEFKVNRNVLIPRQDTEILVEEVLKNTDKSLEYRILDIGSGSGNISISLSKNIPKSVVDSIDINERAIELAKENATFNNVNGNLKFIHNDISTFEVEQSNKYDIIVSNPPYISLYDYSTLEPELTTYEPKEALTDGEDGYMFYNIIISRLEKLLKKKGKVFFEIGQGQAENLNSLMRKNDLINITVIKDYQNIERVVIGESR